MVLPRSCLPIRLVQAPPKVREWQHDNELITKWIATALNAADMLTKSSIPAPTFKDFTKFKSTAMHIVEPHVTFINNVAVIRQLCANSAYENACRITSSLSYGDPLLDDSFNGYPSDDAGSDIVDMADEGAGFDIVGMTDEVTSLDDDITTPSTSS